MPDQAQVTPAGQLVRGQAGGCFRLSLPTKATSHHCQPRLPNPAVAEGAAVSELYSLTQAVVVTSRAAAPRGDCAVGGDERANGGWVTWTMWPAETSAFRTVVKKSTANGLAPDPAPRARMLASVHASPPLRVCGRKASPGSESSRSDDVAFPARASDAARPVVCVGLRSPECGGRSRWERRGVGRAWTWR